MSEALKFPSARQAAVELINNQLCFTRPWFLFFQTVYDRIGGPGGSSTTDLDASLFEDAGNSELQAQLYEMAQRFVTPTMPEMAAQIDQLTGENNELREQLFELSKAVQALQQAVQT